MGILDPLGGVSCCVSATTTNACLRIASYLSPSTNGSHDLA